MGSDGRSGGVWAAAESFPASPASIPAIRHAVDDLLSAAGLDPNGMIDLRLAVTEAATNAVLHGSPSPADRIDLEADLHGDTVTVRIRDYGQGIAPGPASAGLGLGLKLLFSLTDRVEISHAHPGTRITLHFAI